MDLINKNKYLRVWLYMAMASFQSFFVSRIGAILFLFGKVMRVLFFLGFLIILVLKTKALVGYDLWQVILFYLTFNLIDAITQMLFREVYRFRQSIISGDFDFVLIKPFNSLFRSLFGWTDFLDFLTLVPLFVAIGYIINKIGNVSAFGIVIYLLMILNALLIAASFHIIVLSLAVLTTEIDHAIMIYRDITGMGKLPIDIYTEPIRSFITFAIPVGIMMSYPVEVLLGRLNFISVIIAFAVSFTLFFISIVSWKYSLRCYTSASS